MNTLTITNDPDDKSKIIKTNYWETDYAQKGILACSINAGCFRLLIPREMDNLGSDQNVISEIRTGHIAKISRGLFCGVPSFDFDFDDGTDNSFFLILNETQFLDILPASRDYGRRDLSFRAYAYDPATHGFYEAASMPAWYRLFYSLPAKEDWTEFDTFTEPDFHQIRFEWKQLHPMKKAGADICQTLFNHFESEKDKGYRVTQSSFSVPLLLEADEMLEGLISELDDTFRVIFMNQDSCHLYDNENSSVTFIIKDRMFYPVEFQDVSNNFYLNCFEGEVNHMYINIEKQKQLSELVNKKIAKL